MVPTMAIAATAKISASRCNRRKYGPRNAVRLQKAKGESAMTTAEQRDAAWRVAKPKTAAILSVSMAQAAEILRAGPRDDIPLLARAFKAPANRIHNKWMLWLLAELPSERWGVSPEGERYIAPEGDESMRFLTQIGSDAEDGSEGRVFLDAKRQFVEALDDESSQYHEMTRWLPPSAFSANTYLPLNGDCEFGAALAWLETWQNRDTLNFSREHHAAAGLPEEVTTPLAITRACSLEVLSQMKRKVSEWCTDESLVGALPSSLLARISANQAVNRALFEWCRKDKLGREAAVVGFAFLREFNAHGFDFVPAVIEDWAHDREGQKAGLVDLLSYFFGVGGRLIDSNLFNLPMTPENIEAAAEWSFTLRAHYMPGRGGGEERNAQKVHGTSYHLVIFALAVVSTFYVTGIWEGESEPRRVRTARELPGSRSNRTYAVFPWGESGADADTSIRAHAGELIEQIYSQMYFGNLRADDARAYAALQSIRKAHQQQLLEFAVKNRSSQELMNLFSHVMKRAREENQGPETVVVA
jgi:hypothetical protein